MLDGLPSSIRDSLGEFTSARELWLKLEEDYQGKVQGKRLEDKQETEPDPIYEEVDQALVKDDEELIKNSDNTEKKLQDIIKKAERVSSHFIPTNIIKVNEKDLITVKDQVVDLFQKH